MTEAEILEHFWNAQEMALVGFTLYLTVFSGYLIVAFMAGAKLSSAQVTFVSLGFLVACGFIIWGATVYWNIGFVAAKKLGSGYPEIWIIDLNPAYIAVPLLVAGVVGALVFMWSVRHPKTG